MIAIVNYGVGNLGSIQNMLKKVGYTDSIIAHTKEDLEKAHKIILPGVGAFDAGMQKINQSGLLDTLQKVALIEKKPLLGICLGMQLLTRGSDEGQLPGLGWIDAYTHRFPANNEMEGLKVPHMGWNEIKVTKNHPLIADLSLPARFYFVHSYYVQCAQREDELMSCHYGIDFTCALQHENIMGVQFHAEKSHKFGMQLLKNFASA
jgi:glutamine amidotransferase